MKTLTLMTAVGLLSIFGTFAMAQENPFADVIQTRQGLMLQMSADMAKMGAMVKAETPFDGAVAGKAAANVAAIASVLSMDQFPVGSENGTAADSYAKAEIWGNQADFLAKIADLNTAAVALVAAAGTDVDSLKAGMGAVGKACGACHTAYRVTEN